MDRRRAAGIGVAIVVAAATLLLTPGQAVGRHSGSEPGQTEKFFICHEGKNLRITEDELAEHALHEGDTFDKCPKG